MAIAQTTIYNKSGATKFFPFLPPHGRKLTSGQTLTINGDIYAYLHDDQRLLTALSNAITNNLLDVSVNYKVWRDVTVKATSYTVVNNQDNHRIFSTRGSTGAVTFTLPTTLVVGQRWRFFNESAQNMIITAPANKLVAINNLTGTTATYGTASNIIGACADVEVNDNATKYLLMPQCTNTVVIT